MDVLVIIMHIRSDLSALIGGLFLYYWYIILYIIISVLLALIGLLIIIYHWMLSFNNITRINYFCNKI